MLIGREYEKRIFDNLRSRDRFSGAFLFFGDKGVGKFSFAEELARELEGGARTLSECLIVRPDEKGTIGIDRARDIKLFLASHPANSSRRVVIVDDADRMTEAAESAVLKITEEPPEDALIFFIASDIDVLMPTLVSRLKKVYFPAVRADNIRGWLISEHGVTEDAATEIASSCFGRPEFALELLGEGKPKRKKAKEDFKFETDEEYRAFVRRSMVSLYNDKESNFDGLREFCRRIAANGRFNTNKKLQFQTVKWTH
ncbi:MAG: AAA family ATPase [Candidatus Colwellbacteria bacterium]|nr:AAA family ATPase [Candidatus Colwellbacteria bacterium]